MALSSVRDYLRERHIRIETEWKVYSKHEAEIEQIRQAYEAINVKRIYHGIRDRLSETERLRALQSEYDKILQSLQIKNLDKREPFEFYTHLDLNEVPDEWKPKPGIIQLPLRYHKGRTVTTTDTLGERGHPIHPRIKRLIYTKYPQYINIIHDYCRPLGTTIATFSDFNKEQKPSAVSPKERQDHIIRLIKHFMDATPYLPLHFVDTGFAKTPLSTGTGYHNRHSFKMNAHAQYSHPKEYADKPTSKGYYINAFLEQARTIVHYIKHYGTPYSPGSGSLNYDEMKSMLNKFFNEYPTILFTRNHISKVDGALKQRPVYACDELFIIMECMLTFPLLVQARKPSNCIMYGLETIRGSNQYLDLIAQNYQSYFTIDWSSFDQTLPAELTTSYYNIYLPSLIIANKGYMPTYEYPTHQGIELDRQFSMLLNMLNFLQCWFRNMTFLSQNGYAYRRTVAGLPSGMLNTQYLDSYCNLYVIIDALIEFGCTDDEIKDIRLFIMGDDNSGFTHWPLAKVEEFITFLESYASKRWNMKLSATKSVITDDRGKIETLSYQCNYGRPKKDLPKLIAQLCYPERGYIDKYMSMRATGIAFAACGIDRTFHELCKDVYDLFLPDAAPMSPEAVEVQKKFMPGVFFSIDDPTKYMDITRFPTYQEVIDEISTWKGPLSYYPKWNYAHFVTEPDYVPPGSKTVLEIQTEKDIPLYFAPQLA